MGKLTQLLNKIKPAIEKEVETNTNRSGSNDQFVERVTINNIKMVMEQIRAESPIIAELEDQGQLKIVGGLYDVKSGEVSFY